MTGTAPETAPAVAVRGVVRRYGAKAALAGVDLTVPRGSVFGLLGPNGAGKTTLVRILLGFAAPDEGEARLFGRPAGRPEARRGVGFLPERFAYPGWMAGTELVVHHARLLGLDPAAARREAHHALARVELAQDGDRRIRTYSKGMQQRLGIAVSLIGSPELLVWDEPTSALDPLGRRLVRDLILEERRRGATVFLNSHLLGEVERVSDRVAVIHEGRILREGPLAELLLARMRVVLEVEPVSANLREAVGRLGRLVAEDGRRLEVEVPDPEAVPELARLVLAEGGRLFRLEPRGETLEEFFLSALMDENGRGGGGRAGAGGDG